MHEYSITERLFQIALEQADLRCDESIQRLHIELDPDAGYAPDAIRFYFEQLAIGTPAAGAELAFKMVPQPQHIRLTAIDICDAPVSETTATESQLKGRMSGPSDRARWAITVNGVVQSVGFHPFVHKLANQLGVGGWVRNTSTGMLMEIEGRPQELEHFCHHLQHDAPPLAHILSLDIVPVEPTNDVNLNGMQILASEHEEGER